jgi:hypothetical protein|tara:strand:+ start:176 stop:652 length:477 start_codon:yes stop_codon:yes gene_type:complete
MKVVTKKFELKKKKYILLGIKMLLKKEAIWALIPLVIIVGGYFIPRGFGWMLTLAIIGTLGYVGFRVLQMVGFTQHEMSKTFFYRVSYELDGKHLLLKVDAKNGMPIEWKNFQKIFKLNDGYLLLIARGQFIFLPFDIFKTENDKKLTEVIFNRKSLI